MSVRVLAGLAVAGLIVPSSASAVSTRLDFIAYIDPPGFSSGEFGLDGTIGGGGNAEVPIATTLTGYLGSANSPIVDAGAFAYLDGNSAGVGVCKVLTGADQCDPSSDDNVTSGEVLGVEFGDGNAYRIVSLEFRGENHPNDPSFDDGPDTFDYFDYQVGGGIWNEDNQLINAKDGVFTDFGAIPPILFPGNELLLAFNNEQFYLSAMTIEEVDLARQIPLPGGLVLLLGGLGALAGLGARARS